MSREFYDSVASMHEANATQFAANDDGIKRHVTCFVDDRIYVYLHEDGTHIQTQHVAIPERWHKQWPADATVRKHIRDNVELGNVRITEIN